MKEDAKGDRIQLPKVYDPAATEGRLYAEWEAAGYFRPAVRPDEKPFCLAIPPPNITGALHVGHALTYALQDVLVRHRRMTGRPTLGVPGTDHASIATHAMLEQELAAEGTTRHEIGRERFLERAWRWREECGGMILDQLRRLGCSLDWSRERFTMDEGLSRAVIEVFCRLYDEGLIYRGDYIVNWCPGCRTVISDIEVVHEDVDSHIWHVAYPLADGDGEIVVATTRPETMLGDTAVAVHPGDERYRDLIGKECILPVLGRRIPIIADEAVDASFGTGAVKVTPAHDPNDYEMAERHGLPLIRVIGPDLIMTAQAGKYQGRDRDTCRAKLVEELGALGLLRATEPHRHAVGHCQRCDTLAEPQVSTQWFVRMKPLATPAIAAVKRGYIRFVPGRFAQNYLGWMENIHDWCISRQLWWGHQIPAYYCTDCDEVIVAAEPPAGCTKCGGPVEQDPDVLDTWFSSALWPFSVLGWPDDTADLRYFYPTSVLVTAYDIIFFWVARMIFSGLHQTGERPFEDVLVHGLVRDAEGCKMSTSLGNGIDPLEVIERYGADALRFGLLAAVTPGGDVRFSLDRAESARNFANKLWNAARFVLMNLDDDPGDGAARAGPPDRSGLELADRWILARLGRLVDEVGELMERYEIGEAARLVYDFAWGEYCDWYIELAKIRLYGRDPGRRRAAQTVLVYVLDQVLRLLHPVMPFVTEEIWRALPHDGPSIVIAAWPTGGGKLADEAAEADMGLVMEVVRAIRNIRAEMNVPLGKPADVFIQAESAGGRELLAGAEPYLSALGKVARLEVGPPGAAKPPQAGSAILPGCEIYIPLRDLIDLERETARLQRSLAEAAGELERARRRLADEAFTTRAPAEVVAKERDKEAAWADTLARLERRLAMLRSD